MTVVHHKGLVIMICIYCQEDKASSLYTKAEHVLPQSFGRFENNFTLNQAVCDTCNQYFGDNLEITLARDTFEGLFRYEHGIKQPRDFRSMGSKSLIVVKLAEGPYKGAYVYPEYSSESGEIIIKPLPQVGFLKPGSSEYQFFLLNEIPDRHSLEQAGFDLSLPNAIFVFAAYMKEVDSILVEKGITFEVGGWRELPVDSKDQWLCDVERDIDHVIRRAVAKIGFNYLAYWEGANFVMSRDFDLTRRYVRYGEVAEYHLVIAQKQGILADEAASNFRRLGHIITLNWASDRVTILSQISLLNMLKYAVCLARNYSGERKELRRGHFFNLKNKRILSLEAKSREA